MTEKNCFCRMDHSAPMNSGIRYKDSYSDSAYTFEIYIGARNVFLNHQVEKGNDEKNDAIWNDVFGGIDDAPAVRM